MKQIRPVCIFRYSGGVFYLVYGVVAVVAALRLVSNQYQITVEFTREIEQICMICSGSRNQ